MTVYTETFSPYQYAQLRIMEFPYEGFAQAFAGTVPFSENIGFVQDPGDAEDPKRVDYATYVTMHEIQNYLNYNKTSWVFWGMRHMIGNDNIQRAVKRFLIEYHGTKGAPYPTTLELIDILKEETDPEYHQLIDDYWNKITFWDFSFADDIKITAKNNSFTVSIPIKVDKKYASEEDGKETSVTEIDDANLNEWVEIGFYTEDPKDDLGANPFTTRRVQLSDVESVKNFTLDKRPTHIVLDPKRARTHPIYPCRPDKRSCFYWDHV